VAAVTVSPGAYPEPKSSTGVFGATIDRVSVPDGRLSGAGKVTEVVVVVVVAAPVAIVDVVLVAMVDDVVLVAEGLVVEVVDVVVVVVFGVNVTTIESVPVVGAVTPVGADPSTDPVVEIDPPLNSAVVML